VRRLLPWVLLCCGTAPEARPTGTRDRPPPATTAPGAVAPDEAEPAAPEPAPAPAPGSAQAPPPTAIRVPGEVALRVGETAAEPGRALTIELLALDGPRATLRIVVAHGDHEIDLTAGGPPTDVDGVRVRFVRAAAGAGAAVLSIDDDGGRGWSPRDR